MTNTAHPTGIEAIVCADIARRQALGIAKYGTTVADNPLTLREWLMHAYEEKLDAAVYLRRAIAEIDRKQEGHAIELEGGATGEDASSSSGECGTGTLQRQ
jgi:hypothetical protein